MRIWDVLSSSKIQQYYTHQGITWNFIAPRAPWWGGWWERMIGSVKRCLRKVLGKACVDEDGLLTVLAGIETALNSRPIVHEYGLGELGESLTPAHFLNGRKLTTIPSSPEPANKSLTRLWQEQQRRMDSFWKRWRKEYLLDLRSYHEVRNIRENTRMQTGDVVLLHEDNLPRHLWRLARVEKTIPGRDGRIRSCVLRHNNRIVTRPIQLVIPPRD